MSDVDMLLQDTLRDHAQAAPTGAGLLTRVHTRSRLIRRRRRVGAAGAGVAAVLLGAAGAPAVLDLSGPGGGGGAGPAAPAPGAPTVQAPSKTFAGTPDPSRSDAAPKPQPTVEVRLVTAKVTVPAFPFTPPTGVIPGLGPGRAMFDGSPHLYHPPSGENAPQLSMYVSARFERLPPEPSTIVESVQVRGTTGELRTITEGGTPIQRLLSFTLPDGTWMSVTTSNVTVEQLIAYLDGLTPGPVPVEAPFTFTVLPGGLDVDNVSPSDMVFRIPGQQPGGGFEGKLAVMLNADGNDDSASWPLTVKGQPAKIQPQDGGRSLYILQPSGSAVVVQVPANIVMNDADLLKLGAGITVTSAAQSARG
jgi:hypothetical protein